jgi:hypothetical protein
LIASTFRQTHWISHATRLASCVALAGVCVPRSAHAVTDFNPYASIDAQHTTNAFSLPDKEQLAPGASFSDTITRYIVGSTAEFDWGVDKLTLNAEGSRYEYAQNDNLSHFESKFGGLLGWRLTPIFFGSFEYSQARSLSAPGDTLSQQLEIQTDRILRGALRLMVTPRWRLDVEPEWHQLDSPLPAYPEFGYRETSTAGSILYLGIAKLTAGVRLSYLDGAFYHIIDATKYNQKTAELTSNYAVTNFTSFNVKLGYTWRNANLVNPGDAVDLGGTVGALGDTTAFTGELALARQLSIKTALGLKIFREVDSYAAGANPDISTGVEGSIKWDPDFRFSFAARYRYSKEIIEGTQAITGFSGRSDHIDQAEFSVRYQTLRWLSLRPYVSRYSRSSNLARASYNATVVGIDLTARLHPEQQK